MRRSERSRKKSVASATSTSRPSTCRHVHETRGPRRPLLATPSLARPHLVMSQWRLRALATWRSASTGRVALSSQEGHPHAAAASCDAVLRTDSTNVKALYRRAQVRPLALPGGASRMDECQLTRKADDSPITRVTRATRAAV